MAENKTKPTAVSPHDYIAALTDEQKRKDSEWLIAMMEEVTGEPPVMWGPSIIGFGSYHYKYASGREGDMIVVGFSPRKSAFSLYIMSGLASEKEHLAKLGKHKTGKSCLYVKRLSDIDTDVLRQMVVDSVAKVRENDIHY
ncbi:MAG: DUF1801 domain-containing protein [Bacteroidota bacterium]